MASNNTSFYGFVPRSPSDFDNSANGLDEQSKHVSEHDEQPDEEELMPGVEKPVGNPH
jgi:hypothetical protein